MQDGGELIIRRLRDSDSLDELTVLLHRAYKQLADMGMRFFATYQSIDDTRNRVTGGECFVAEMDGTVVGTVTWYHGIPKHPDPPLYSKPGVARFGQLGVEPHFQRRGIGLKLIERVELAARQAGCTHLALDTAEGASHLIQWYAQLGFKPAGHVQWGDTNYRSVLMCKSL